MARTVLVELLLFLAPFAIYAIVLWSTQRDARDLAHWHARILMSLAIGGLLLMIGGLIYFAHFGGAPPGGVYEPARLEDGKLVPGRIRTK
ncbi:MAG TPA: DUF6111 family protein [Pseudolabrys sp.]|jgi:hypothetical protein|nr:DUF6111 family protein [Pseudolabrys sp.]